MVNYRYLGYGITNDKGIAKLEFDANGDPITHSYTGTGAGELDIIASLDDNEHISDSSLQSETYSLFDTLFYDKAVGSSSILPNFAGRNNFEIVGDDEGTLVTNNNTANRYLYPKQSSAWVENNSVIEFTYVNHNGGVIIRCNNGTSNADTYLGSLSLTNGDIVKVKILDNKIEYYKNDVKLSLDKTYTVGTSYVAFILNNSSVKFRDFKIYPI